MAARTPSSLGLWLLASLLLLLAGCAHHAIDEADRLARAGRYEEALQQLDEALQSDPTDGRLRSAHARQRDRVVALALAQADLALAAGRPEAAELLLNRVRQLLPQHPRLGPASAQLQQALAQQQHQQLARERDRTQRDTAASTSQATPLSGAAAAASAGQAPGGLGGLPPAMSAAYQKPVSLELRDAPLRQVFEVLARASGMNFVFDKEVRGDSKVTVFLRNVTLDEALRVVMATQGLDRKLLNESTLLVYPNTQGKQREHQELVTRTLYLVNADARQALSLVRTMTKTRDLYADERLNLLVVRDTPEVVRQVEQLIATLDLPEPEVMLAVEVMEVATSRVEELGLSWPTQLQYGVPNFIGQVTRGASFSASVANPVLLARLRGDAGNTNLLANPTIRVRQRDKAKVQIGERLPVFSTTSVVNAGVSVSVNYLDVGLKLEVEPTIQLDGDVSIKLAMEVSNLLQEVSGPQGSIAYKVGTRLTSTSLRLKDGETQVLAGLINDEDRRTAVGVPGLSTAPLLGKLFGVQGDTRNKTEIVMLITPRIVRRTEPPSVQDSTLASGTDGQPGAAPLRLRPQASAGTGVGAGAGGAVAGAGGAAAEASTPTRAARPGAASAGGLQIVATRQAAVGATLSVGLVNRGQQVLQGELVYDAQALVPASGGSAGAGRARFDLSPGAEQVLLLRVQPGAAGQTLNLQVQGLAEGVAVEGDTEIRIEPAPGAKTSQARPNTASERAA